MITIISGTNRAGSNTRKVAELYRSVLAAKQVQGHVFSLEDVNTSLRNHHIEQLEQEFLAPASKFIFIMPEYNGSIPGVLKCLVDITDIKTAWWGKKALLTGVSTGRAGNLRGMEHFTGILNDLKVVVHPNKLPISCIHQLLSPAGELNHEPTLKAISEQVNEFLSF